MRTHPFEPRPIRFLGIRSVAAWRLKLYAVLYGDAPFDLASFAGGLRLAESALPAPDDARGRPGLGFLIAHRGKTGDYCVLGFWEAENELPLRVFVRRPGAPLWRPARAGESVCVWDLEVIWAERQAWVETVLTAQPNEGAYLERVLAGARA